MAEVVRTTTDPFVGRQSLVRVFSGTLRPDEPVHISGHLQHFASHLVDEHADHDTDDERIGPLAAPVGDETRPIGAGIAGDIVVVSKLAGAETSDTLSRKDKPALVEPWVLPNPLLPVAIHARSKGDEDKLATRPAAARRRGRHDAARAQRRDPPAGALGDGPRARRPAHRHARVPLPRAGRGGAGADVAARDLRASHQGPGPAGQAVRRARAVRRVPPRDRAAGARAPGSSSSTRWSAARCPATSSPRWRRAPAPSWRRACWRATRWSTCGSPSWTARPTRSTPPTWPSRPLPAWRCARPRTTPPWRCSNPWTRCTSRSATTRSAGSWPTCAAGAGRSTAPSRRRSLGRTVIHAEVPAHELARYPVDLRSVSHGTGSLHPQLRPLRLHAARPGPRGHCRLSSRVGSGAGVLRVRPLSP